MEILRKGIISAWFPANRPKLWGNCTFPQNFHTRKSCEITVFFPVYCSKLRQDRTGWWKPFFDDMVDLEVHDPSDPAQVDCLLCCFINILRKELYTVSVEWNHHILSKSIIGGPNGLPDTMFFLPHLHYSDNFLENADSQEVAAIYPHVTDTPRDFSDKFQEFSEFALQGNDHNDMPSIVASDLNLFCI